MSPFGVPEEDISHLPKELQKVLSSYLKAASDRYYRMRNALIVFACIAVLGCAAGILEVNNLSQSRHRDTAAQVQRDCWSTFNGRVVLRALVGRTGQPLKYNKQLAKTDPALNSILQASAGSGQQFKDFAFKLLVVPHCNGHNPNPVAASALKLAGLKNIKQ